MSFISLTIANLIFQSSTTCVSEYSTYPGFDRVVKTYEIVRMLLIDDTTIELAFSYLLQFEDFILLLLKFLERIFYVSAI